MVAILYFDILTSQEVCGRRRGPHRWPVARHVQRVGLGLGLGAVQHLQEGGGLGPHARVDVRLRALDVVVKVVPEMTRSVKEHHKHFSAAFSPKQVDEVNGVVPGVLVRVPGEEDEGDVAHAIARAGVSALQPARGVAAEQNLK